jgi:hypothetical protein
MGVNTAIKSEQDLHVLSQIFQKISVKESKIIFVLAHEICIAIVVPSHSRK